MKHKTKNQLMWEVSNEQEVSFRKVLLKEFSQIEVDEFFKLVRGSEYRRGKEDQMEKEE